MLWAQTCVQGQAVGQQSGSTQKNHVVFAWNWKEGSLGACWAFSAESPSPLLASDSVGLAASILEVASWLQERDWYVNKGMCAKANGFKSSGYI